MTDVVIVSAARTAVGKFGGSLAKIAAPDLGAIVIRALLERSNLKPEQISEVILGQVLTAGSGQNPARQSLIKAGLPSSVPHAAQIPASDATPSPHSGQRRGGAICSGVSRETADGPPVAGGRSTAGRSQRPNSRWRRR